MQLADIHMAHIERCPCCSLRIEDYPDDKPYASYLVLGRVGGRALHVVAADNDQERETIVITVYEPDPDTWDAELRRRSKS